MDNAALIATLNTLVQTCDDCEAGFRACAEERSEQHFKVPFRDRAIDCATAARTLRRLVHEHGGSSESDQSKPPPMHLRWVGIEQAIVDKDGKSVLDECERGEDVALLSYRNALGKELPAAIRSIVEVQYQAVLRNHALVRHLREEFQCSR